MGQKEVRTGVRWEEPSVASMAAPTAEPMAARKVAQLEARWVGPMAATPEA